MTEQLRQSLSAVIDGEADAFEVRRVIDELGRDPELRATWDRYHLIGSVIRGERTLQNRRVAGGLASRVPLAIRESSATGSLAAQDAPVGAGSGQPVRVGRGRRGAVGLALAASIVLAAAVAFVGIDSAPSSGEPQLAAETVVTTEPRYAASAPAAEPEQVAREARVERVAAPVDASGFAQASPTDLRRAHAYMLQHARQRGLEQTGVISLVKMATYEAP